MTHPGELCLVEFCICVTSCTTDIQLRDMYFIHSCILLFQRSHILFYNDYNEWVVSRSDAIVHFLTEEPWNENHEKVTSPVIHPDGDGTIYGDGLIDGIGMQGHLDDTQNIEQFWLNRRQIIRFRIQSIKGSILIGIQNFCFSCV